MSGQRYRIQEPTIAMFYDDERGVARRVPVGTVVELHGPIDDDKLVEVVWDGKPVMMFTQDLRSRAQLIE